MNFTFKLEILVTKSRKTHKYENNNKHTAQKLKTKQSILQVRKDKFRLQKISGDGQCLNENVSSKKFNKSFWLHK